LNGKRVGLGSKPDLIKGMVAGIETESSVLAPIYVEGGVIDLVEEFSIWAASLVVMGNCMVSCLCG